MLSIEYPVRPPAFTHKEYSEKIKRRCFFRICGDMTIMEDSEKLIAIRKICLEIDKSVHKDPTKWRGSLEWVTGQIMCVAKYGDGYENFDASEEE